MTLLIMLPIVFFFLFLIKASNEANNKRRREVIQQIRDRGPIIPAHFNPSVLKDIRPIASVFHKAEYETVAMLCIDLLIARGNVWRKITWEEYKEFYKIRDMNDEYNKPYFEAVIPYIHPNKVGEFSDRWNILIP